MATVSGTDGCLSHLKSSQTWTGDFHNKTRVLLAHMWGWVAVTAFLQTAALYAIDSEWCGDTLASPDERHGQRPHIAKPRPTPSYRMTTGVA
ncbi:unnamed protein product [Haemonchus placei]|uniref:Innexin n=1 Tax=Haemonchus placei TaxID=6290 RepID=A0A0N4VZ21_HAEPC|nr:unnamed protein product [Haemonchus placei]